MMASDRASTDPMLKFVADYPVPVPGLANAELIVRHDPWLGPRFLLAGKRLRSKRGRVEVPIQGAPSVVVRLARGFWREPAVHVGEEKIVLAPGVPRGLFVLAMLPMGLILGGVFGAIFGCAAMGLNMGFARARWPAFAKVAAMLTMTALAASAWL